MATSTTQEDRRAILLSAANTVQRAGQMLRQAAASRSLHELDDTDFTVAEIDASDFVRWVYGNGMDTIAGAKIRDQLMAAAPDDRCPLCRQGRVYQLDHFLPKTVFPILCVDPLNLVPVCERCNLKKGNRRPDRQETTFLHPYLDRIPHDRWLDARTSHGGETVRLEFFVNPPAAWDATLTARVTYHFEVLELGTRYATDANRVITDLPFRVDQLRVFGGAAMVRAYLQDEAITRFRADSNSIEGVVYETLAGDDRYCQGQPSGNSDDAPMATMQNYGITWTDPTGTPRASAVAYDKPSAQHRKATLEATGCTAVEIVAVKPGELPEPRANEQSGNVHGLP
ncbi:HNH endonuclease family protein [Streptomyces europaeiscabiei]|uniref:hypothetical protein n=1 Tax=Streptomyces europaeiscabiei TaxID=146819 RepID=UPI0029AC2516|nr:hypothetical protein [Streptomyces europaeiscabiei]MDX3838960.1 hypothetical protein [Streptomyces europaeiscabiei]